MTVQKLLKTLMQKGMVADDLEDTSFDVVDNHDGSYKVISSGNWLQLKDEHTSQTYNAQLVIPRVLVDLTILPYDANDTNLLYDILVHNKCKRSID